MVNSALESTQTFFASRAAGWDARFTGDEPRYEWAVQELAPMLGATVVDLGCGTGRALIPLRTAVGPQGQVIGLDATWEMLYEAQKCGRGELAQLWQGDVLHLPLPNACCDGIFAAGLVPHLDDAVVAGLTEMARITRTGGRLAIFHPISRTALAARHGRVPSDDDIAAPARMEALLTATGWRMISIEDGEERYLALAER